MFFSMTQAYSKKKFPSALDLNGSRTSSCYFFPCFCHVTLKCRDMIQVVDTKKPVCLYTGLTQINSQNLALGSGIEKHQDKRPFCNGLQFHSSYMNIEINC